MKNHGIFALVIIVAIAAAAIGFFGNGLFSRQTAVQSTTKTDGKKVMYNCPMHPNYIADKPGTCPICGMDIVPMKDHGQSASDTSAAAKSGVRIDPNTVQNIGVKTETVEVRDLQREIRASGTIEVNEKAVSVVTARIMGYIEKLNVDFTGQNVQKGQSLLELYSPELVTTQEEYLQAVKFAKKLVAGSDDHAKQGAEDLVESSKRRLLNWDIPLSAIEKLEQTGVPSKTMSIPAPASGIVLDKMAVQGQKVMAGMELYKIADLSTVWVIASIFQDDLPFLRTGMDASVELQSAPGKTFRGKVSFISPVLDMESKTIQVRIEVANTADFALKPNMFATVKIASPVAFNTVAVPDQSIIRSGKRNLVIVALGNGYFQPREVVLGVSANGNVQIIKGLSVGETIVTSSQFLIDSESNLKAAVEQMTKNPVSDDADSTKPADTTVPAPMHRTGAALKPQESCPIMGEPINKKLFVEQNGKRIYVCCAGCTTKVRANFRVSESKLASLGEAVEIVGAASKQVPKPAAKLLGPQKTCPVMGSAIDKEQYVDVAGKRIYVCCQSCKAKIAADPAKYIAILKARGESVEELKK